ncbi:NUDIX hydrolase [Arthrobacter gengyunqii]|uniref:NUDIX hydrolase n=1 Tax=Arthrobacter gengyunqii TaxID=2886940 RepID=A0ABS8GEF3_9MICC|nr:NUDIX hydrolase [Arthrobacter gengyunqii]
MAEDGAPGVVVVGVASGHFAMVEHWRPAAGRTFLEFPRGFGTPGGSDSADRAAITDARRELREETGLQGTQFQVLGRVWADSSLLQGHATVVGAALDRSASAAAHDTEIDALHWVPVHQVPSLMEAGVIADGLTLSAYALWSARRQPREDERALR